MGLSAVTKCPELELDKDDCDKLARASEGVARHYNVEASEKALAWTNLVVVGFTTYAPRFFAMKLRWAMEKDEKTQRAETEARNNFGATVMPLRPGA